MSSWTFEVTGTPRSGVVVIVSRDLDYGDTHRVTLTDAEAHALGQSIVTAANEAQA
jgi:hypothetical protein